MNKTFSSGAALHRLIEDAPIHLLTEFLRSYAKDELDDLGVDLAETPGRKHFAQALSNVDERLARRLEATRVLVLAGNGARDLEDRRLQFGAAQGKVLNQQVDDLAQPVNFEKITLRGAIPNVRQALPVKL